MNFNITLNLVLITVILLAALVVFSKNPIHSILALVLLFFYISILFLFLKIEFVAIIMLIIYVGALTVLFLFVVMMLNIRVIELEKNLYLYIPFILIIIGLFFFQLYYIFNIKISNFLLNFYDYSTVLNNILNGGNPRFFPIYTSEQNLLKKMFLEKKFNAFYNFIDIYMPLYIKLEKKTQYYDTLNVILTHKTEQTVLLKYKFNIVSKFVNNNDVIKTFGSILYGYYSPYFITLGFVLLLAMIGSIALVLETKQEVIIKEIKKIIKS